jgi:hypothetical protein
MFLAVDEPPGASSGASDRFLANRIKSTSACFWPLGSVANADAKGRFFQDSVLRWEPPRNLLGPQAALGIRAVCASP